MKNSIIVQKKGSFLLIITFLLAFSSVSNLNGQILLGPSYGTEISNTLGDTYARSGFLLNASYFVSPNIALNLGLAYFSKALVDSSFNNLSYWNAMSEMFSVDYFFLTSNVRPFIGLGLGHVNDALTNKGLPKYFNVNSLALGGEAGLLANLAPRFKLHFSVKYNYLFSSKDSNVTTSIGLLIPLKAN
jgi:outer membrane protein W